MKIWIEYIIVLICLILIYAIGVCKGATMYDEHDANRDGVVDARDYVAIKNYIMEEE